MWYRKIFTNDPAETRTDELRVPCEDPSLWAQLFLNERGFKPEQINICSRGIGEYSGEYTEIIVFYFEEK